MPYLYIPDFREGLDTRKMAVNQGGSALVQLLNMHITRGGELEKRKAFVPIFNEPRGVTTGLYVDTDGVPVTFTSRTTVEGTDDFRIQYLASDQNIRRILDVDTFNGKRYVVAQFEDDFIRHYYDGERVTSFPEAVNPGIRAIAHQNKMYTIGDTILAFSGIAEPTEFDTANTNATGQGFIELNSHAQGYQQLTGVAEYQNNLAIFSDDAIQVWFVDDDPARNQQLQVLLSTGTFAPDSVVQFGGSDVFYLDRSGVRSLRVRDSSNNAYAQDVGTPVDTLIQQQVFDVGADMAEQAQAAVEPTDGRYWLAIGDQIFVFSFFRQSKVSAWSVYEAPGEVTDIATYRGKLYLRAGDTVYLYGGETGDVYDDTYCEVQLPWLSAESAATFKRLTGVDLAAEGVWTASIGLDPNRPEVFDDIGTITQITYPIPDIYTVGRSTHFSLKLTSDADGYARIGSLALHYRKEDQG